MGGISHLTLKVNKKRNDDESADEKEQKYKKVTRTWVDGVNL
jgi:hypothetical protein